jgi:hypothetical protein
MFETINRLALVIVKRSTHKGRGGWKNSFRPRNVTGAGLGFHSTLAAEIASLLPVRDVLDFEALETHLVVLRTTLRMNPPFGKGLKAALAELMNEARHVRAALEG